MFEAHSFKNHMDSKKQAPKTVPKTKQNSKPRATNPRVLQRTEGLPEEGPAAVGVALKFAALRRRAGRDGTSDHLLQPA